MFYAVDCLVLKQIDVCVRRPNDSFNILGFKRLNNVPDIGDLVNCERTQKRVKQLPATVDQPFFAGESVKISRALFASAEFAMLGTDESHVPH